MAEIGVGQPDLKSAGNNNEDRIGRRVLQDQRFAAQQVANLSRDQIFSLLVRRQFAEDS